jgi:hypothetical protein
MDNIQQLISGYLDNELSAAESGQLAAMLQTDASSLDAFILDSIIHSQLLDLMDEKRMQDRVIRDAVSNDADGESLLQPSSWRSDGFRQRASGLPLRRGDMARRSPLPAWGAVAAALLVAASISMVGYVLMSRPTYIGTLTEASAARWKTAPANIAVGAFLQDGQELELISGTAVITFSNGARLYMEGPTTVRIDSPKDVQLVSGKIAAKVPIPAIGFTVHSSLADFIDLGTEFTVQLDAERTFQLHVFDGLVEVRLDKRFGTAAQRPAHIAEVLAVTFDVKSGDIVKFPFEEGKKMPF